MAKKRCGNEMENRSSVMVFSGTSSTVVSAARVGSVGDDSMAAAVDCMSRRRLMSVAVEVGLDGVPKP